MDAFFLAAPDRLELTTLRLTAECSTDWAKGQFGILYFYKIRFNGCSNNLSSRAVSSKVLSALVSLTSVFGMRTGGTSPLTSPQWYIRSLSLLNIFFRYIYYTPFWTFRQFLFTLDPQLHRSFFHSFRTLKPGLIFSLSSFRILNSLFYLNLIEIKPSTY